MIKTKNGKVKFKGCSAELLADLGAIVRALYYDVLLTEQTEDEARKAILEVVDLMMLPDRECIKKMVEDTLEAIRQSMDEKKEEE